MTKTTLLTGPTLTPEEVEAQNQKRAEAERIKGVMRLVVDRSLEAYCAGEITLDKLCSTAVRATDVSKKNALVWGGLDRQKLLGAMLEQAMASEPPKRGRGNKGEPTWLRALTGDLLRMVQEHEPHMPTTRANRTGKPTAYARVVEILKDAGVSVTPSQVEEWTPAPKTPAKKDSIRK